MSSNFGDMDLIVLIISAVLSCGIELFPLCSQRCTCPVAKPLCHEELPVPEHITARRIIQLCHNPCNINVSMLADPAVLLPSLALLALLPNHAPQLSMHRIIKLFYHHVPPTHAQKGSIISLMESPVRRKHNQHNKISCFYNHCTINKF